MTSADNSADRPQPQPPRDTDQIRGEQGDAQPLVVGIGVSAGSQQAISRFFDQIPPQSNLIFVLVHHIGEEQASQLVEILQNERTLPVVPIKDGLALEAGRIYVGSPGWSVSLQGGIFHLSQSNPEQDHSVVVDRFFRSLAADQGQNAVGVVLSDMGVDGMLGLEAIKEHGGLILVRSPAEAETGVASESIIQTNLVDVVGSSQELAAALLNYQEERRQPPPVVDETDVLGKILVQVRSLTGHDFTPYKQSMLLRRVERRRQLHHLPALSAYLSYLNHTPDEVEVLFYDFLISVTRFFRDEDAFAALEKTIIPKLFAEKGKDDVVRVWVPGCATGEEAYSIAILLWEHAAHLEEPPEIQVFATDINRRAIATAREGLFPPAIADDVSEERLQRFFNRETDGYRVVSEIRDLVLFSIHNLLKDPPFSRLDLISCRNLLIYLERTAQKRILEFFHYALLPEKYLFLGASETIDAIDGLFASYDKQHSIFTRQETVASTRLPIQPFVLPVGRVGESSEPPATTPAIQVEDLYRSWQRKQYAPPSILVDEEYNIFAIFNGAGRFLLERDGRPSQQLLKKVLPALRLELRTALFRAFQHRERTKRLLCVEVAGQEKWLNLIVGPVTEPGFPQKYVEVVFDEVESVPPLSTAATPVAAEDPSQLALLEEELQQTRERLQSTVEAYETANEELLASNEELQSMNEELRSTSEELETSKEELQSMNEELVTVNQELKHKIEELDRANSDLQNLIESTDIATIFLDRELRVKRYTPRATELFHLIPSDLGRPFAHISHKIACDHLSQDAGRVLQTLVPAEKEVQSKEGAWYIARLSPYRTLEDRIDGVVMTLVNVTDLKEAEQSLRVRARQQAVVAELGQMALENTDRDQLFQEATRRVANTLGVELCKVLELLPDGKALLLKAGVGWREGYVGKATVGTERASQAGYTLHSGGPIVVEDLNTEERFHGPDLLLDHNVVSGLSVVIRGTERDYGVLGAHTTRNRAFSKDDVHFVQSVANVLAHAIERRRFEEALAQINRDLESRIEQRTQDLSEANARLQTEVEERKRAQERFYTVFHASPAASALMAVPDLRYLNVNHSFLRLTGYSEEEVIGRTSEELGILVDTERRAPIVQTLLDEGSYPTEELRIRTKSGEIRHILVGLARIELEGQPCLLSGFIDITEHKRAEEALRKSQKLLSEAEAIAHIGSWEWDIQSNRLYWSPELYRIYGVDPATFNASYEGFLERIHRDDRGMVEAQVARARQLREPFTFTHRIIRPDGTVRILQGRGKVICDEAGQPVKMLGTGQDITERQQMEDALRRSEQRLRMAIEVSGAGLYEHGVPMSEGVYYSKQWAAILGYTREELPADEQIPEWMAQQFHPEDRPHLEQVYQDLLAGQIDRYDVEARVRHKQGHWIQIRALAHATARDQRGRTTQVVGIIQDITEQKEREAELRAHQERLQEMVEERTTELAAKTKELAKEVSVRKRTERQLLRLNETLEERVAERTEQVRSLATALTLSEQRERQRIAQILHDHLQQLLYALLFRIKFFSSQDAQQEQLVSEFRSLVEDAISTTRTLTVDLSPPILSGEGLVEALRWLSGQMKEIHHFDVEIQLDADPPSLSEEERVLLFQIVRELLFNVIKHSGEDQAHITVTHSQAQLAISVRDEGTGFDTEILGTPREEKEGWGLLHIRERLGLFDGRLEIESQPGQGTQVTIYFPLT